MARPPDSLPDDARALKELLIAARDENERLIAIIKVLQRHRFGPRSEKIDPDQLVLMLEDVEQAIAAAEAEAEAEGKREPAGTPVRRKRQINRGALPKHLPREEVVVDLADKCRPGCNRLRVKLGEDVSERLDMIPARFKVIVTRRPKYACRDCAGEVAQAPAPEHLIEGGIPTEAQARASRRASGRLRWMPPGRWLRRLQSAGRGQRGYAGFLLGARAFAGLAAFAELFLKRKLSFAVSRMWQR